MNKKSFRDVANTCKKVKRSDSRWSVFDKTRTLTFNNNNKLQVEDNTDHTKTPTLMFLIKSAEAKDR